MLKIVLFCIFLLFPHVNTQRPDYEVEDWQKNKFWSWSSKPLMTEAMDEIPDIVNSIKMILDHFKRVEDRIVSEVGNMSPPKPDALLRACRSKDRKWPNSVRMYSGIRGFADPDISCISDFVGVQFARDEIAPYSIDQLYDAIYLRGIATQANARSIVSQLVDVHRNFTRPTYVYNFRYDTSSATCLMHPVLGIRERKKWRTSTAIHNRPMEEALPELGRQRIVEFHRVVNGHLTDNALLRLPVYPEKGKKRVIRDDTTTLISGNRGDANPSLFRNIPIEENPAILEALDTAAIYIQQAEDAITPSNIAILSLPLLLNIIPVALFADVSTIQMLLYALLSDVLTVTPLLIKGAELIQIKGTHHRAVVTRVSSSLNSTRSEAAAAEMWAAECQVRDGVRTVGVIFVSLSVMFLIAGILLELTTRNFVQRRRRRLERYLASLSASMGSSMASSMSSPMTKKFMDEAGRLRIWTSMPDGSSGSSWPPSDTYSEESYS